MPAADVAWPQLAEAAARFGIALAAEQQTPAGIGLVVLGLLLLTAATPPCRAFGEALAAKIRRRLMRTKLRRDPRSQKRKPGKP
jgi:hypothetical protein